MLRQTDISLTRAAILDLDKGIPRRRTVIPTNVREVDVFCLLLWRFRWPNGMLSRLGQPGGDPDGPYKWDFSFCTPCGMTIAVQRTWRCLETLREGTAYSDEDVVEFFRYNISLHKDELDGFKRDLERHRLMINPYVRHRNMAIHAEEQLRATSLPPIIYPNEDMRVKGEAGAREIGDALSGHMKAYGVETYHAVTLVTESAYMAEAFLNLLLAVSLHPHLRSEEELFNETLKRTWLSKLKYLPITSQVVSRKPDMGDARIGNMKKVFGLRNAIAHSYPDDKLLVGNMYFLAKYPVLESSIPYPELQAASVRLLPTRSEALSAKKFADKFTDYIVDLIDPSQRAGFVQLANASILGYNEKLDVFSVPFGSSIIMACMVKGDEE